MWNGADPDPYTMYGRYFGTGANLGVPAGYSSAQLQKLLAEGDTATTPTAQKSLWTSFSKALTSIAVWILALHRPRLCRPRSFGPWLHVGADELDLARLAALNLALLTVSSINVPGRASPTQHRPVRPFSCRYNGRLRSSCW